MEQEKEDWHGRDQKNWNKGKLEELKRRKEFLVLILVKIESGREKSFHWQRKDAMEVLSY